MPQPKPDQAVDQAGKDFRLSERGAYNHVHCNFWDPLEKALEDPWKPENPDGTVMLGLAENSMMHDEVSQYIVTHISTDSTVHLTYGNGPKGSPRLRKSLASFLNSHFHARQEVMSDEIIIMSGVTSTLDAVTWSICNEGEGILIPRPQYTGFQLDIPVRSRGVLVPVSFWDVDGFSGLDDIFDPEINRKAFEKALQESEEAGVKIKAVLFSHPHNPLGRCYPVETLKELASFCGDHNLHLISDEIYAMSVFHSCTAPNATPFTSILAVDLENRIDPKLVHLVYGASKDFCANGLRLGILQSRNRGLLGAVGSLGSFAWPSYIIQDVWASMLEDEQYLNSFLAQNQRLLAESWEFATKFFDKHGIEYYREVNAAMFVWIDLRRYILPSFKGGPVRESPLRATSPDAQVYRERGAWFVATCIRNGVFIGQGSNFFAEELGWFRITFTAKREALQVGLERVIKSIKEMEGQNWEVSLPLRQSTQMREG